MAGQLNVGDSAGEWPVPFDFQVECSVAKVAAGGFDQKGSGKYQIDLNCAEADLEQVEARDEAAVAPWESTEADKPAG